MFAIAIVLTVVTVFAIAFLHSFGIFGILLIHAMLAWFALPIARAAELVAFALITGVLIGYVFRSAIASEISKLSLATIISKLENLAKEDAEKIREEVSSLAASLRKHL